MNGGGGEVVPRTPPSPADPPCYPTNPCQEGLHDDWEKRDAGCTVTPGAPGRYTCKCGQFQSATFGPAPSTCLKCPSANPCAFVYDCSQGTECQTFCGDQRGTRCAKDVCDGNPCGPAGVCAPEWSTPYPYTCDCQNGFVSNYGTCVPREPADVI
ncbi:hypothetical protein KFL_002850150 [Klebsormidium nitens]|uniref:EGF-like domain-containing protein n=1 Tax=Klebsormidium nitens TaxID=105231 RepID=A0A1Y1I5Y8_KLENI|nr:hypothetical protein KFL_002850150 [Klebsormidium nitens]|eukprot:GAQ86370.1 hypothetical protein KFL_002850150 [Klebsormidium nitens]